MREVSLKQEFMAKDVKEELQGNKEQFNFIRQAYTNKI